MISFTLLDAGDKYPLKHFIKQQKLTQPQQSERVYIAKQQNKLIGMARIIPFDNQAWLRGLYIDPNQRQKGYGANLVRFLLTQLNEDCIGFIQPELISFYQRLGFYPLCADQIRPKLKDKYQQYLKSKPHLSAWGYSLALKNKARR
ncbi:GNAT family N-acetyltransferase [Thiomicrospira sp. R3]|uniref:GNAT family N-acetyltransferase n=1 Tax=Thiomicrospira sp. R3 TaxID=3035472 RepID=UPI00259AEECA|nr:GNAT family N-acetyltransferase [Thiomicrospira sp. R3]WFE67978.1 GNAT family N-acetyltransferase [Thiomicrospira sp. R3]